MLMDWFTPSARHDLHENSPNINCLNEPIKKERLRTTVHVSGNQGRQDDFHGKRRSAMRRADTERHALCKIEMAPLPENMCREVSLEKGTAPRGPCAARGYTIKFRQAVHGSLTRQRDRNIDIRVLACHARTWQARRGAELVVRRRRMHMQRGSSNFQFSGQAFA